MRLVMSYKNNLLKAAVVKAIAFSLVVLQIPVAANDIVPTDDLSGGASVFVFRGSSKKPQGGGGVAVRSRAGFGTARPGRAKIDSQIAANQKQKMEAKKARAAEIARMRARERVVRLKQSNALAAKGEAQLDRGELDSAIASFRESLKLNPKNSEAVDGLSDALTAKGIEIAGADNNEAALKILGEAVTIDPKNAVAYAKIGEIHDSNGRNANAIANYEKVLSIDPAFTAVLLPIGLAHAEAKNYVEAEAYLEKAEAAGIANREARMARAEIMIKQGRWDDALKLIDRVIAAEPTNAFAIYLRATALDGLGRTDDAIAGYQNALSVDPELAPAWFELGITSYNRGDYQTAARAYGNVVRIEPTNYEAQANLASSYRQLERYPEANAAYKAAEPGNTKNPDHYSEWGFCLGKTSEWDKAIARLLTARELSSTAVDNTNLGWAYYNAALIDRKNGNEEAAKEKFALAKQYLNTAVEQDPKLDAAYLNLGSASNALGDHAAAVAALNIALALRSDWVIAMNQLGLGYRGLNNLAEAINVFRRVTSLDSRNVFGLYNLGEAYHLTGNKKEAKKVQDSLKKIDPAFASKLEAVLSGKAIVDDVKRKIDSKVPRIPRIPY